MNQEYSDQVEGRNSVIELLESGRDINKIFISEGEKHGSISKIIGMAKERKIIITEISKAKLNQMAQTENNQGVIAIVPPFNYCEVEDILEDAKKRNEQPFIVILDGIDLTNSTVELKNIKSLKLEGENTINHINAMNQNQAIFTYSFNNAKAGDKVLADNDDSYLKIFTNKTTNPFSGNVGTAIDFKFFKPFKSNSPSTPNTKVRLVDDANKELKFDIPDDAQRLGILLGNSNNNKTYNLYHGNSGTTGTSVYVAGNTDQTFRESFDTQSNSIQVYDYVRRANPVNKIDIDAPANIGFNVNVPADQLDVVKPNNWNQYFVATDLEVKNDSLRIKDQFTDEHGVTHHFGETNSDLELGYLGVSASNTGNNSIELVSNTQLDPNIISSDPGVKLALKLSDGTDSIPLNERDAQNNPLKTWIIQPNALEKLTIEPNFDSNDNF